MDDNGNVLSVSVRNRWVVKTITFPKESAVHRFDLPWGSQILDASDSGNEICASVFVPYDIEGQDEDMMPNIIQIVLEDEPFYAAESSNLASDEPPSVLLLGTWRESAPPHRKGYIVEVLEEIPYVIAE